jgi:hypothetical protein
MNKHTVQLAKYYRKNHIPSWVIRMPNTLSFLEQASSNQQEDELIIQFTKCNNTANNTSVQLLHVFS